MDQELVLVSALALFCLRDARLAVSRPRLLFALVPLLLLASVACGVAAENLSEQRAGELLGDPRLWGCAMLLHAALASWAARKSRRAEAPDWVAVLPTPITGIGMTLAARIVLVHWDGVDGAVVGLVLGIGYGLVVGMLALPLWPRRDGPAALRFSSLTHLSALMLVPSSAILDSPLATEPTDWGRAALVLASVAALVAASFFWHRSRSR